MKLADTQNVLEMLVENIEKTVGESWEEEQEGRKERGQDEIRTRRRRSKAVESSPQALREGKKARDLSGHLERV